MPQGAGFAAWVIVDGVVATEYNIEVHEDHRTITCWIASEVGKSFSVGWRNGGIQTATAGHVIMDGNDCGGRVLYGPSPVCANHEGVTDGRTLRQFKFSSVTLTDDDAYLGSSARHQKLGLIEVTILPIQVFGFVPVAQAAPLPDVKLHERSKTAVTQQIKLGEPKILTMPQNSISHRFIGPPFITFVFRYRPLDILRANGIVPLPPQLKRKLSIEARRSPTPDDDQSDAEEIRVLQEKLNALQAKRAKKKGKKVHVKEEENVPPVALPSRKKAKLDGRRGPAVDLT